MSNTSRKVKKTERKKSKPSVIFLVGAVALVAVILAVVLANRPGAITDQPAGRSGDLVINIKDVSEKATYYPIEVDGIKMEVLAVKAPDGTIRTALNTCQVCYDSGRGYYVQEGSVLVCQNCGNRFRTSDVEKVRGGCNPVPIMQEDKVVDNSTITVPAEFLQKAKGLFADWKR